MAGATPLSIFGNTEETFLLASLKEFVKVWASGNQAKISMECNDGKLWYKLIQIHVNLK